MGTQEKGLARAILEPNQGTGFSVATRQQKLADASQSIPTTRGLRASRQRQLKTEAVRRRRRKFGELRRVAKASRPDICARLAQLGTKINSLKGSDAYKKSDLIRTAKEWRRATVLKNQPRPHIGTITLAGWSDAVYGDHPKKRASPFGLSNWHSSVKFTLPFSYFAMVIKVCARDSGACPGGRSLSNQRNVVKSLRIIVELLWNYRK